MRFRAPVFIALMLSCATLQGCGSSAETRVDATTTGQELTDLKRAYDEGVITPREYERKRSEILRRR
jgi:uncharacterized membrane protein